MNQQRSTVTLALASLCLVSALGLRTDVLAQTPNPFVGNWRLNLAKSTYNPGPAPKAATLRVDYKGETRTSVLESMNPDGTTTRSEYSARADGKDYPIKGSPTADTISLRRVNEFAIERTDKRGGHVVMVVNIQVARDGKTLTVTQKGVTPDGTNVNNRMVYERQ